MKLSPLINISQESILFQNGKFFEELVKLFEIVKKRGYVNDVKDLDNLGLSRIIKKYTNMSINSKFDINCGDLYISVPRLDPNNVLNNTFESQPEHGRSILDNTLSSIRKKLSGTVDIKTGKVGGTFATINTTMFIDPRFFFGIHYEKLNGEHIFKGFNHTCEEMAAIVLHEVGHLFTAFEYIVETASTNMALSTASKEFLEIVDTKERIIFIDRLEKSFELKVDDKEALVKENNQLSVYLLFVSCHVNKIRSSTDTYVYDIKSWEFLADQFAIRHGAGRYLAEGFYHFDKYIGVLKTTKEDRMISAVSVLLINMLLIPVGIGIVTSIFSLFYDFRLPLKVHDEDRDRITRIRNDMMMRLKNPDLSEAIKKSYITDIDRINELLKTMEDTRSLMETFWDYVRPLRKNAREQQVFQQKMEYISSNPIYLSASKLSTLV